MKPILLSLQVLAALSLALAAPMAHASPQTYHLTVTVSYNGQNYTNTLAVPNPTGSSVINVPVSSGTYNQIQSAFGTTTFVFGPGTSSYTGNFVFGGVPYTVTISDDTDSFTLAFQAH